MKTTKKTDHVTLDEKVLLAIIRASEFFKRNQSALLSRYGLTFSQYNVLRVLDMSINGKNTPTNISKIMYVGGSNLAGVSKRLRNHGFIVKSRNSEDERLTFLVITEKGRKALKDIEKEKDRSLEFLLQDFSSNQKKELLGMLIKILKKDL